jgi:hypothetical protein
MPTTDGQEILTAFDLPPEKAIEKLKELGISVTGDWNAMMADAESRAFVLAKITQADLLETVKSELELSRRAYPSSSSSAICASVSFDAVGRSATKMTRPGRPLPCLRHGALR